MMAHESPAAGRVIACRKHSPWTMERDRKKSKAHLGSPECHEVLSEGPEDEDDVQDDHDMTEQEAQVLACLGQLNVATLLGSHGDADGAALPRAGSAPDGQRRKLRGSRALSTSYQNRLRSCLLNESGSPVAHGPRSFTTAISTTTAHDDGENQENVPPVMFVPLEHQAKCWLGHRHPINAIAAAASNSSTSTTTSGMAAPTTSRGISGCGPQQRLFAPDDLETLTSLKDAAAAAATSSFLPAQGPCDVSPAPKPPRAHRRSLSGATAAAVAGLEAPCGLADSAETLHGHDRCGVDQTALPLGPTTACDVTKKDSGNGDNAVKPSCAALDAASVSAPVPSTGALATSRRPSRRTLPSVAGSPEEPVDGSTGADGNTVGVSLQVPALQLEQGPATASGSSAVSVAKYGIAAFGVAASVQSCFAGPTTASASALPSGPTLEEPLESECDSGRLFTAEPEARVQLFGAAMASTVASACPGALAAQNACNGALFGSSSNSGNLSFAGAATAAGFGSNAGHGSSAFGLGALHNVPSAPLLGAPGRYAGHAAPAFSHPAGVGKPLADSAEELELRRLTGGQPFLHHSHSQPQFQLQPTASALLPPVGGTAQAFAAAGQQPVQPSLAPPVPQAPPLAATGSGALKSGAGPASAWGLSRSNTSASAADLTSTSWSAAPSSSFLGQAPSAAGAASSSLSSLPSFDLAGLARSAGSILFTSNSFSGCGDGNIVASQAGAVAAAQPSTLLSSGMSAPLPQPAPMFADPGSRPESRCYGGDAALRGRSQQQHPDRPHHMHAGELSNNNDGGAAGMDDDDHDDSSRGGVGRKPDIAQNGTDISGFDQNGSRRWLRDMGATATPAAGFDVLLTAMAEDVDDDDEPWLRTSQQAPDPDDPASADKYSAVLLRRLQEAAAQEELGEAAAGLAVHGMYYLQVPYSSKPYGSNGSSLEPSPMPRLSARMRRLRGSPCTGGAAGGPGASGGSRSSGGGLLTSPAPSHLGLRSRSAGVTPGTDRRLRRRSELDGPDSINGSGSRRRMADVDDHDDDDTDLGAYSGAYRYDVGYDAEQQMHDDTHGHHHHHDSCDLHGNCSRGGASRRVSRSPGAEVPQLSLRLPQHAHGPEGGAGDAPLRPVAAAAAHWHQHQRTQPHAGDGFFNGLMDYEDEGVEYSTPPHTPLRGMSATQDHDYDQHLHHQHPTTGGPGTSQPPTKSGPAGVTPHPARDSIEEGPLRRGLLAGHHAMVLERGGGGRAGALNGKFAPRRLPGECVRSIPSPPLGVRHGNGGGDGSQWHVADGLDSTQGFNRCIAQAANNNDRGAAERLWHEMCSRGIAPDIHTLNALLRCLSRSAASPEDAQLLVCEVCGRGGFSANGTSQRLLEEICFRFEQLHGTA